MRVEINGKTGLGTTILTLGCGDGTEIIETPLDNITSALQSSGARIERKLSTLAEDINGTVDKEISVKIPKQVINNIEISGEYAIRWTTNKSSSKLGHGVVVPNDPSEGWDKYKSRICTGSLYVSMFNGKNIFHGNTIDLERLADNELMSLAAI